MLIKDFDDKSHNDDFEHLTIYKEKFLLQYVIYLCHEIFETRIILSSKNIEIRTEIDNDVPKNIYSDQIRLKQIIINLTSNSFKFTTIGSIIIKVEKVNEDYLKFSVIDTGSGISPEQLKKLNIPYIKSHVRGNEFGTGIGLTICKDMVKKIGKDFLIESEEGRGTIISFLLNYRKKDEVNYLGSESVKDKNYKLALEQPDLTQSIVEDLKNIEVLEDSYDFSEYKDLQYINNKELVGNYYIDISRHKVSDSHLTVKDIQVLRKSNLFLGTIKSSHSNYSQIFNPKQIASKRSINSSITDIFNNRKLAIENLNNDMLINITSIRRKVHCSKFFNNNQNHLNIILCEDDILIRQAEIRTLMKVLDSRNYSYNIVECIDGIEGLYEIFVGMQKKIKYDYYFTDQSINFMNGDEAIININKLISRRVLYKLNVVLVTSYAKDFGNFEIINEELDHFMKPLSKAKLEEYLFPKN